MTPSDQMARQQISVGVNTPFYIYDLNTVKNNFLHLRNSLSGKCKILFSMKSNPHPQVVHWFSLQKDAMVDVCSLQELKTALRCDFIPSRISFVGPGKTQEEIEFSLENSIGFLVIESISELEKILEKYRNGNYKTQFLIRVAMRQIITSAGIKKEGFASQFGLSEDELEVALKLIQQSPNGKVQFAGLHCFVQSQQLNVDNILQNFNSAFELHERIQQVLGRVLPVLNLGGGFGVPYFDGQSAIDLGDFNKKWIELYSRYTKNESVNLKVFVESGRFLTASAGSFYTKVLYCKNNYGKNIVICDGGLTQNLMAIGFGQSVRRNFKIFKVGSKSNEKTIKYTLAGPSCYSLDTLALDIGLPELSEGDLLRVDNCGAYGPTFSPQNFLSRPHAQEFIIDENV